MEAQAAAILTLAEARAKELEIMTKAISSIVSDRIEKCGILPENCRAVTLFRCAGRQGSSGHSDGGKLRCGHRQI